MTGLGQGAIAALGAALLFGAGTPFAKLLLPHVDPWLLAALLYLGSGIGLWLVRRWRHTQSVRPSCSEWGRLAGTMLAGGMVGPVLLMVGLGSMSASGAALLLNAEAVFTALIAWFVFKEHFDRHIALGMLAIVAGAVVLSWPGDAALHVESGALAVLGAAALLGFLSYGASLVSFVVALRHLGTVRTGAYFSVAPFFGALLGVVMLNEPVTAQLLMAGALMAWARGCTSRSVMGTCARREPTSFEHAQ